MTSVSSDYYVIYLAARLRRGGGCMTVYATPKAGESYMQVVQGEARQNNLWYKLLCSASGMIIANIC
jgi:hypothetical protein